MALYLEGSSGLTNLRWALQKLNKEDQHLHKEGLPIVFNLAMHIEVNDVELSPVRLCRD